MALQNEIHSASPDLPELVYGGRTYRIGDRVMQCKNDYDMLLTDEKGELLSVGVFNGEVGTVCEIISDGIKVNFDGRYTVYP